MTLLKNFVYKYGFISNVLILILNLIILGVVIYETIQLSQDTRFLSSEVAIERISHNLGISPDWQSLWKYIRETIQPGMSRDQVLKELDKVGPYVIKDFETEDHTDICEMVEFQGLAQQTHYPLWFCYQNNEVKSLKDFGSAVDD